MRIGFDLHGTIDRYPKAFARFMKFIHLSGGECFIISGPPKKQILEELQKIPPIYLQSIIRSTKEIISVVDWLKAKGVTMEQDENGNWWAPEDEWWNSKGNICGENKISVLYDDSIKYKPSVLKNGTKYKYMKDFNKPLTF